MAPILDRSSNVAEVWRCRGACGPDQSRPDRAGQRQLSYRGSILSTYPPLGDRRSGASDTRSQPIRDGFVLGFLELAV